MFRIQRSAATVSLASSLLALSPTGAIAHDLAHYGGVDGHAPIGVMGDHMHKKGEVMWSYRYMFMEMEGSLDGSDGISNDEILQDYRVAPTRMTMQMHMLGAMYAPSDRVTLMAMLPYSENAMDHVTRMGTSFSTRSQGQGDLKLGALWALSSGHSHSLHLNTTLSAPTGQINEEDDTPAGRSLLPYPMQLGSGTWDLTLGGTYRGQSGRLTWGAQALGTTRFGENDNGYKLGDKAEINVWTAWKWSDGFSSSWRLKTTAWSDIDGEDPRYAGALRPQNGMPPLVATIDPDRRSGNRTDLLLGGNWLLKSGNRIALEIGLPVHQHLSGPQLETDFVATLGWQKSY